MKRSSRLPKLLCIAALLLFLFFFGGARLSRVFLTNRAVDTDVKILRERYQTREIESVFVNSDPAGDRSPYTLCGPIREVFPTDSVHDLNGGWGIETYYFPVRNKDGLFSCVLGVLPVQTGCTTCLFRFDGLKY